VSAPSLKAAVGKQRRSRADSAASRGGKHVGVAREVRSGTVRSALAKLNPDDNPYVPEEWGESVRRAQRRRRPRDEETLRSHRSMTGSAQALLRGERHEVIPAQRRTPTTTGRRIFVQPGQNPLAAIYAYQRTQRRINPGCEEVFVVVESNPYEGDAYWSVFPDRESAMGYAQSDEPDATPRVVRFFPGDPADGYTHGEFNEEVIWRPSPRRNARRRNALTEEEQATVDLFARYNKEKAELRKLALSLSDPQVSALFASLQDEYGQAVSDRGSTMKALERKGLVKGLRGPKGNRAELTIDGDAVLRLYRNSERDADREILAFLER
jgi:hypothetical protein